MAYLGVIRLACAEQCVQRVIAWNDKAGKVHKEFAPNVEKDEKEVDSNEA